MLAELEEAVPLLMKSCCPAVVRDETLRSAPKAMESVNPWAWDMHVNEVFEFSPCCLAGPMSGSAKALNNHTLCPCELHSSQGSQASPSPCSPNKQGTVKEMSPGLRLLLKGAQMA